MKNSFILTGLALGVAWRAIVVGALAYLLSAVGLHTGWLPETHLSMLLCGIVGAHLGLWSTGAYTQRTEQIN